VSADARRKPPRSYDGPIDVESAGQHHKDGGYALAIELGTGGPKVAIVSFEGRVIGSESESSSTSSSATSICSTGSRQSLGVHNTPDTRLLACRFPTSPFAGSALIVTQPANCVVALVS
jgi:hypothetical protein